MFEYSYPRLDANVTKGMNHLLKSPFSVHPKTGKISVPIDSRDLSSFDPCQEGVVPTLEQLCQQVEQTPKSNEDSNGKQKDYVHTSLKPFVDSFSRFVQRVQSTKHEEILSQSDLNTALSGQI